MFDKYVINDTEGRNHRHTHDHNVKITEQRAPTDDSVRLLKEMQEKSRADLIGSYIIEDNSFNGVMDVYKNAMTLTNTVVVRFYLNNIEYITESSVRQIDFKTNDNPAKIFYSVVSEAITEKLLNENIKKLINVIR